MGIETWALAASAIAALFVLLVAVNAVFRIFLRILLIAVLGYLAVSLWQGRAPSIPWLPSPASRAPAHVPA